MLRACSTLVAAAALAALVCTAGFASPTINNLSFYQADWYDGDGVLYAGNSSWGRLDVDVTPDPTEVYYLNVQASVSGTSYWIVKNFPVFPATSGPAPRQSMDFDIVSLGLAPGTDLSGMDVVQSVTPDVQLSAPTGASSSVAVGDITYQASGGKLGPWSPDPGRPAGIQAEAPISNEIHHDDVDGVQEGNACCLAGSFARSISWLDKKYHLGINKTAQQIYEELRRRKVSNPETTYEQDITAKANYLNEIHNGAKTKILKVGVALGDTPGASQESGKNPIDWLRNEMKTEDVELHYDTHIITVTGIYQQGDEWFAKYRDDEDQGNPRKGDDSEKNGRLYKDGDTWKFRQQGGGAFDLQCLISESVPEPSAFAALAAGLVCLAGVRRRRAR